MYIKQLKINNFRNFDNFEMKFKAGLNVLVGSNNSGKTGLLKAIKMIHDHNIVFDDFNKNNLQANFNRKYTEEAPEIVFEYQIEHQISEADTTDESITKLLHFINMEQSVELGGDQQGKYTITANIKMRYCLPQQYLEQYKKDVANITDFNSYCDMLKLFLDSYQWEYTNGVSATGLLQKEITGIFRLDFIEAERNSDKVYIETKRAISEYLKDGDVPQKLQALKKIISLSMQEFATPALQKIDNVIQEEKNDIGLSRGHIAITQSIKHESSIEDSYIIDINDTKANFNLPLSYNGLGYNNLINMYMLIKLVELQKGKDFRILCIEEPEAHLHPAMQYKLFKYLKMQSEDNQLNQQIFVTTHSPNITAVAGLDNMYMIAYERATDVNDCKQCHLAQQFTSNEQAKNSRAHLLKFLDVTRSDMLFADKVILVEGIAEKLLLPKFMELCKIPYEDNHISIVEIGGKHFEHFIQVFYNNPVKKHILCITDMDFDWYDENDILKPISGYASHTIDHVKRINDFFPAMNNLKIVHQKQLGSTFEDELIMANISETKIIEDMLKIVLPATLKAALTSHKTDFPKWYSDKDSIDGRFTNVVKMLEMFQSAVVQYPADKVQYENLFFAKLFLTYAKKSKGQVALELMVDEALINKIKVPKYIADGLEWLK